MDHSPNPQAGMEKRVLLALALSFALLVVWSTIFSPPPKRENKPEQNGRMEGEVQKEDKEERKPQTEPDDAAGPGPGKEETAPQKPEPKKPARKEGKVPVRKLSLENKYLELKLSSEQAGITRVRLKDYYDTAESKRAKDPEHRLVLVEVPPGAVAAGALIVEGSGAGGVEAPLKGWEVVEQREGNGSVAFRWSDGESEIIKRFILPEDKRHLKVKVTIKGPPVSYTLCGPPGLKQEKLSTRAPGLKGQYGICAPNGKVRVRAFDIAGRTTNPASVRRGAVWAGVSSCYFTAILRGESDDQGVIPAFLSKASLHVKPDPDPEKVAKALREVAASKRKSIEELTEEERKDALKQVPRIVQPELTAKARKAETAVDKYELFLGPKSPELLQSYGRFNYEGVIDYGYFVAPDFLVQIFYMILKGLRAVVRDYGVAIIFLTVLVKLCLHPLNRKNQKAMQQYQAKLSKIQPELDRIKQRYKNNRRKMHQEMQKKMSEQGVNPQQMLGGCLLMFLQLPVWVALIAVFRQAVELRQAPAFFGLLNDLSLPDRTAELGFIVPILGWKYLNVLPILYVVVTLINQRLMPKPQNEQAQQQQKMMGFMMVFFGVIFYSFSSGLLLYFLTNSVLGIAEQRIIRREIGSEAGTKK